MLNLKLKAMKKKMLVSVMTVLMGVGITTALFANESVQAAPVVLAQEEVTYSEIDAAELLETITATLRDSYADYTISKALLGSDGSYKVKLSQGEEHIAVFFNANGEFLKVENVEKEDTGDPE